MATQKQLKQLMIYDPDTGLFYSTKNRGKKVKVGDVLGSINGDGYLTIWIPSEKKNLYAHRLAAIYMMGDQFNQKDVIDHDDKNKSNNKWNNLNIGTQGDNMKNQPKRDCNTSGVTGVYWMKSRNKWNVKIGVNGESKHIGNYIDFDDAVKARKQAEIKYNFHLNHGV